MDNDARNSPVDDPSLSRSNGSNLELSTDLLCKVGLVTQNSRSTDKEHRCEIRPTLVELYEYVTPDYAANWKIIGTLLDIPNGELNCIEASNPTNAKWCCDKMWDKWLEIDNSATWGKLLRTIESPALPNSRCSKILKEQLGLEPLMASTDEYENETTPQLKDLYECITPKYAAKWRLLGELLGLPKEELDTIEVGYPINPKWCCNKMLEKWLDRDPTASWHKMNTAITELRAVCSASNNDESEAQNDLLKALSLFCLYLTKDSVKCRTIEQSQHFKDESINLSAKLSEKNIKHLAEFISSSSIKAWIEINLSSCNICNHIHTMCCKLGECDVTIKSLRLNDNHLTGDHATDISKIVLDFEVQKLFINKNQGIGESKELYIILTNPFTCLLELHMCYVKLSSNGAICLFNALQHNSTLKDLVLTDNEITDDACESITTALQINNCLVKLWIWNNPINELTSTLIMSSLINHNNSLMRLGLSHDSERFVSIINSLAESVNRAREDSRCDVRLSVDFM